MKTDQKGFNYIGLTLVAFAIIMGILIFPLKLPKVEKLQRSAASGACTPEDVNNPNAPKVTAKGYTFSDETDSGSFEFTGDIEYRRVKKNVPIDEESFERAGLAIDIHWTKGPDVVASDNKRYRVYYPSKIVQDCGGATDASGNCQQDKVIQSGNISYSFPGADGQTSWVHFYKHGMVVLVHLNDDGSVEKEDGMSNNDQRTFWISDIYVDPSKEPLPEDVIKCKDIPTAPGVRGIRLNNSNKFASDSGSVNFDTVVEPMQDKSPDSEQLQLQWFQFAKSQEILSPWWTPHCKPAVYLYPQQKTEVNVKVAPLGHFTYTDPPYDLQNGWNVEANPDGVIRTLPPLPFTVYPYLYYEAAIRDNEIEKPTRGYVIKYENLPEFLSKILPNVGLNAKETADFKEYWEKTLPKQNYYFIGPVSRENLDHIEPLEVSPKPDSVLRISLYFEALDEFKVVLPPDTEGFERKGFSVVEWGGLVKLHKGTQFTCSQ